MPHHRQVTTCRKSGGPVSKFCTCPHCTLAVCSVCGGGEGALTTDCPGEQISGDRLAEICETSLDFTEARGWHQGGQRSPHFEKSADAPTPTAHAPLVTHSKERMVGCVCGWRTPAGTRDSEEALAWHVAMARITPADWKMVDRVAALKHELTQKAISWVLADRICDDHSARLTRVEDEIDAHLQKGLTPNEHDRALHQKLEYEKIGFSLADQRAQKCDDEFRQIAKKLVEVLEATPPPQGK